MTYAAISFTIELLSKVSFCKQRLWYSSLVFNRHNQDISGSEFRVNILCLRFIKQSAFPAGRHAGGFRFLVPAGFVPAAVSVCRRRRWLPVARRKKRRGCGAHAGQGQHVGQRQLSRRDAAGAGDFMQGPDFVWLTAAAAGQVFSSYRRRPGRHSPGQVTACPASRHPAGYRR